VKNKNITLFVYNGSAEIDWILPVLYKFSKKKYKINTYFKSESAYNRLKSNHQLYYIWNKINNKKYIETPYHLFLWKLLRKFLIYFKFDKSSFFLQVSYKIHDINFIKKKFNLIDHPNLIFSEFGVNSGWVASYKNHSKRHLIIHYPSTPYVYLNKPRAPKFALRGDALILGNKLSKNFFTKQINKNKIFISGNPTFDKQWIKKILNSNAFDFNFSNLSKNKKFITIAYSSFFNEFGEDVNKKLAKQLDDIMSIISKYKNVITIFKIHPRKNNPGYLKVLKKYDKNKWIISKTHLMKLAKISQLYLHPKLSATLLDSILVNTPTVQYWSPDKNIHHDTINTYEKIKLVVEAENRSQLKTLISNTLKNKNNKIFLDQQKNFKRIFFGKKRNNSTNNFISIIRKFKV